MSIPEIGVKRPVTTAMIFIAVLILGGVSLTRLGLDLLPDIEIPSIMVLTTYEGAGPEEVEERITRVAEEQLATVDNLDKIEAFSQEGMSGITLRFNWGTNLDNAVNDVRDKLDRVKPLIPDEADDPVIYKLDVNMMPILVYGVSAEETYPRLKKLLEDNVCIPLESVSGVASAVVRGGLERAILVELDAERLKAYNISIAQVENAIVAANLSTPGGHIKEGKFDYIVRVPEEIKVKQIEDVAIGVYNGIPIKIKDIAEVKDSFKEITQETHVNRRPGMNLMIQKESDANTVNTCRAVFKKLETLKKTLPSDVKFSLVSDSSDQIVKSINNLKNSLISGGILVVLVIFLFLGNIRSSIIIASAIPISLIITFVFLYMAGYTINIISLSALAIAIGMVVDASIVVHENIHRHLEDGEEVINSCIVGGNEVAGSISASVLCIVAIFLPIMFTGGLTAIFFGQLAFVCSATLIASLFTALMLIPMLSSKLLSTPKKEEMNEKKKGILDKLTSFTEVWFKKLDNAYGDLLRWCLRNRKKVVFGSATLLFLSLLLVKFIGTEFIPEMDEGRVAFKITLPIGTRYEKTGEITKGVEDIIYKNVPEIQTGFSRWGEGGGGLSSLLGGEEGSNIGSVSIKLIDKEKRTRTPRQIAYDIKDKLNCFPDAEVRYNPSSMSAMLFGGTKPLSIGVRGYDFDQARILSHKVEEILKNTKGVDDVEISRKEGKPELQVLIDREKASTLGLNVATISHMVETSFKGKVPTYYRESGDEYDIEVRLREEDRTKRENLENLLITLPSGKKIHLTEIAEIKEGTGPLKIERRDRERVVRVEGEIYGRDLGSVVNEINEKLEKLQLPQGFSFYFGGEYEEQQKSFRQLTFALILGIILVFMIMAAQFESIIDPFVIMFAIPFALIGVVWALFLSGNTLSIFSFIGVIMIVGIGLETGIVLISFIKDLRKAGVELHEAVVQAGKLRLRAVLMTTLTTIFGLLPLALSKGEGAEMWVPLGWSLIGGLLVSFLLTLFFVPILYTIYEEKILQRGKKTG